MISRADGRLTLSSQNRVVVGFFAIFAILSLMAVSAYRSEVREDQAVGWVSHTQTVLLKLKATRTALRNAEASRQRFLLTGSPNDRGQFAQAAADVAHNFSDVAHLTVDNPVQQRRLPTVRVEVAAALASMQETMQKRIPVTADGGEANAARRMIGQMEDEEFRLLERRLQTSRRESLNSRRTVFLLMGFAFGLLCVISILTRRYLQERERAEAVLRQTSAKHSSLAAAIANLSVGVLITDPHQPDNPLVFVNPAFTTITGYSAEEALGRNPRFMTHPDGDPAMLQSLREAIRERRLFKGVMGNRRKDGTLYRNSLVVSPVFDTQGTLINFAGLTEDVTTQYEAQEALRESETRFASMVANVPGMIYRALRHADGTYERSFVSEGCRDLLGIGPEDFRTDALGLGRMVHPEDSESFAGCVLAVNAQVQPWHWQGRFLLASGEEKVVQCFGHPDLQPDGDVIWDCLVMDMTAQYKAQEALRESETRFASMVANVPGMIYRALRDADGVVNFIYTSEGCRALFGLAPEQFLANPLILERMVHPADTQSYQNAVVAANQQSQPWHWQGRFVLPSGEEKTVQGMAYPTPQASGGLIWDGLLMDVTERVQAEQKAAQLAAIVEGSDDAIKSKTLDGIITSWNRAAERMYGYTAAEMIGQPIARLLPPDRPHEIDDLLRRIARGERVNSHQTVRLTKDGTLLDISLTMSPIRDSAGQVIGASSIARDVTDQHHAEERLRLLAAAVESANDVILITEAEPFDQPGPRVVYVNDAFTRVTGYTPEEILGKTPRILQGPGTDPETRATLRRKLEAWEPVEAELLNYRKDGTPFWVQINIRPVADASGWYTHWVSIQRDVTERRRAEEERRQHLYAMEAVQGTNREIVDTVREPLLILDAALCVQSVNRAFYRTFRGVRAKFMMKA